MGTTRIVLFVPDECLSVEYLAEQWDDGAIMLLRQLYDAATWRKLRRDRGALMARHPDAAYYVRVPPSDVPLARRKPVKGLATGRRGGRRDMPRPDEP